MKQIAFVIDPIETLNPKKDTTIAMMEAALTMGWQVSVLTCQDLSIRDGQVYAVVQQLTQCDVSRQPWYRLQAAQTLSLQDFDLVMMRKDPPFDINYLMTTYLLELAEQQGVRVVNKPASIREANEKLFALHFPDCMTDTIVTAREADIRNFLSQHHDIILKPLNEMGGAGIFRLTQDNHNISAVVEILTQYGSKHIMAQKYLPAVRQGDKRILLIDGKPAVPFALARIPKSGETRANLAVGGSGKVVALTERDHWLCQQVGPTLKAKGLVFVGLDVIGDYVTEINVTSPTCVREIMLETGENIALQLMQHLQ